MVKKGAEQENEVLARYMVISKQVDHICNAKGHEAESSQHSPELLIKCSG